MPIWSSVGTPNGWASSVTSSAAAHEVTPFALRECRARHPGLVLEIGENNAAEITEAVADGRLHCGLLRVPVARPAGLVFDTLQHEPAMVALPIDHPLAQRQRRGKPLPIQIADLEGEPMILVRRPGAPGLYANLLALCAEQGVRPRVVAAGCFSPASVWSKRVKVAVGPTLSSAR